MRTIARLVLVVFALCLAAGGASAKFKPLDRPTDLVDPILDALAARADDFPPDSRDHRTIERLYAFENRGAFSVFDDLDAVYTILNDSSVWTTGGDGTDPALESIARQEWPEAIGYVQAHFDSLNSWVAAIETDNPLAHLAKTKKAIQKAQDHFDAAQAETSIVQQWVKLASAENEVAQAESSIHLSTAPKSCKLRRLLKGEFGAAISSPGGLFRANAGQATFRKDGAGNVTGLDIYLFYCDGRNADYRSIHFRVLGTVPGTYPEDTEGGFQPGTVGFGQTLAAGSSVTITTFDVANQVVAGTFNFTTNGGLQGTWQFSGGAFRFEQIS